MKDTPRTDKIARGNHVVPTEWAEDLEREGSRLREALREIQQLARGHTDKIVLLANVAAIAQVAGLALEERIPASEERVNTRRLERIGFTAPTAKPLAENG